MPDVVKHSRGPLGFDGRDGFVIIGGAVEVKLPDGSTVLQPTTTPVAPLDWELALKIPSVVKRLDSRDLTIGGSIVEVLTPRREPEVRLEFDAPEDEPEDLRDTVEDPFREG